MITQIKKPAKRICEFSKNYKNFLIAFRNAKIILIENYLCNGRLARVFSRIVLKELSSL